MSDATVSPSQSAEPRPGSSMQFLLALSVTVAFLAYLLLVPSRSPRAAVDATKPDEIVAEVIGPGLIQVKPGGPFDKRIVVATVRVEKLNDPVLTVSGRVAASLRPGKTKEEDYWQFDSPEVLTTFTDWQKAHADIAFTQTQLKQVKKLAEVKLDAQQRVVDRLQKLVEAGTDTLKDLTAEKANLIQTEITGKKEIHEAESAVRVAKRNEAAMSRQLQQAGLDPDLLKSATSDIDIVMADVPEGKLSIVKEGAGCRATFFGLPNQPFEGTVSSIAPVLSKERRSLRVLFAIKDLKDQLRSGMFAEIGIGTDPRDALLMPAEGILHIGRADYALAAGANDTWRVVEVKIGEPHRGEVQILEGLTAGERVVGQGAILFKPLVMRSLDPLTSRGDRGP